MDKAISKASVCEILADMYPTDGEKVISVESIDEAYDKIIKLPTIQSEQYWIPCSVKVPEVIGDYLTTTIDKGVYCDVWNGVNFNRTELVIAWMPIPEPYEGDSDGTC